MKRAIGRFTLVLLMGSCSTLHAYDQETHREMGERAAAAPGASVGQSLDQILKRELGLSEGIAESLPGRSVPEPRSVQQLIGDGAFFEDVPFVRALNHFHDPLVASWEEAGLLQMGQSSVLWQQNPAQDSAGGGGDWSWQDARRHYLDALTRASKEDRGTEEGRDRAFADTFETLGHLVHLVQDASVPAHVRNDPHPTLPLLGLQLRLKPDWYEEWAEHTRANDLALLRALMDGAGPVRPPVSIFTATGDAQAPVPVARLMDSDRFRVDNVQVLEDAALGIAEYTNGNFLSRGTRFESFVYPRTQSLGEGYLFPIDSKWGQYFPKIREGESVEFFVREGTLYKSLTAALGSAPPPAGWFLDDRVHQDYARRLLPRAVGYSAALLDYFFRGTLDVDLVADPADSSRLKLVGKLVNRNGPPNEAVAGTLALYWDDANGARGPVPGFTPVELTGAVGDAVDSASFLPPASAARFVAVYQGQLGEEPGAVIGKVRVGSGGVEELLIDDATGDLYFRNRNVLARLDVREQLTPAGAPIGRVIWGNDRVSFMVAIGSPYYWSAEWAIFELSARPARNLTWVTPPTARLVRQETFDIAWTAAFGGGIADEVFTIVLDSRRDILYGGHRGREIDPYNYKAAVLVNQSRRTTLWDYGIAILGEFGGGSVPYLVYADGADLAGTVLVVKSWAYLDWDVWGYAPVPFRTSVWVGSTERILHADTFGAPSHHELNEQFGWSDDPVWPHSTRRHVLYWVNFIDTTIPYPNETIVTRVYLHDVERGVSRVVAEDRAVYPTPELDLIWKYDFRGSANTGVDRLFQASSSTQLSEDEREAFVAAWDRTTGEPLLDVTAVGYPPIDAAAKDLATLLPIPSGLTPGPWRAIQVVE